jgi:excisionase family DNA binding protein
MNLTSPLARLRVYTAEQTATVLQLSVRKVLDLLRTGELPGRHVGRQWRISESSLISFLEGRPPSLPKRAAERRKGKNPTPKKSTKGARKR